MVMTDEQVPAAKTWAHALARRLIGPLRGSRVTPNHLTTLRLVTGIAAALAFATGHYGLIVAGGAVFMLSALLDRADGELARLSSHHSRFGHRYDIFSDIVVNVAVFIGMGFGLTHTVLGGWAPWFGIVAGVSVALIFWLVILLDARTGGSDVLFDARLGFDLDDTLFLIGPVAWLDGLLPLLVVAVIGAPAFMLWLLWRYCRLAATA